MSKQTSGLKQLKQMSKELDSKSKGVRGKKESALDKCTVMTKEDEIHPGERALLDILHNACTELKGKVQDDLDTLDEVIGSQQFFDLVVRTANNTDDAKAIVKNLHTRLLEVGNFVSYYDKLYKLFDRAMVTPDE